MAPSLNTTHESEQPGMPDPAAVREQLERLLTHPLFANSKRYPALLAYVVEQTLAGNAADLKERSIGVEVFGRDPSYDSNADPVVRITAGEVRKRLSQYYYDPEHAEQLVIELPIGSYVPAFRVVEMPQPMQAGPTVPMPVQTHPSDSGRRPSRWSLGWQWLIAVVLVLAGLATGVGIGRQHPPAPLITNMDRFWQPVTSSASPTTFCLGDLAHSSGPDSSGAAARGTSRSGQSATSAPRENGSLALADVVTLTRTVATMEPHNKMFRVVPAFQASFARLREGPIVLIGGTNNAWTLRLTQKLRFGFALKDGVPYLVDRKRGSSASWTTQRDQTTQTLARDFAIVARIHDSTTGQPVIIAAGLSDKGTEAAGEILYNPMYLSSLLAKVSQGWERKNLEAVIETQVIQGHPGPPNVIAVETW